MSFFIFRFSFISLLKINLSTVVTDEILSVDTFFLLKNHNYFPSFLLKSRLSYFTVVLSSCYTACYIAPSFCQFIPAFIFLHLIISCFHHLSQMSHVTDEKLLYIYIAYYLHCIYINILILCLSVHL